MSRATRPAPIEALSPREHEVAKLIMDGLSNKLIAVALGISEYTAKFHVNNTATKIGNGSRVKTAVAYARWLDAKVVVQPSCISGACAVHQG